MSKVLVAVLLAGSMVVGATVAHAMGGGGGGGGGGGAGGGSGGGAGGNWPSGAAPAYDGSYANPAGTTSPVTHTRKRVPSQ